jgi:hypothetical protein
MGCSFSWAFWAGSFGSSRRRILRSRAAIPAPAHDNNERHRAASGASRSGSARRGGEPARSTIRKASAPPDRLDPVGRSDRSDPRGPPRRADPEKLHESLELNAPDDWTDVLALLESEHAMSVVAGNMSATNAREAIHRGSRIRAP